MEINVRFRTEKKKTITQKIAALYIRGDNKSSIIQRFKATRYAENNGLVISDEAQYIDSCNANVIFRPEFARMLKEAGSKGIETVVIDDIGRLGRDILVVGVLLSMLEQAGLKLIVMEP